MKKRKRNYKLIKGNLSYTYKEISELFNLHIRSVQEWRKKGMKVIDENTKPFLVLGTELKRFIKHQKLSKQVKLGATEFYCTRCRCARESIPSQISIHDTCMSVGKSQKLFNIFGLCKKCGARICRLTTARKLEELKKLMLIPSLCDSIIPDNIHAFLNTDI